MAGVSQEYGHGKAIKLVAVNGYTTLFTHLKKYLLVPLVRVLITLALFFSTNLYSNINSENFYINYLAENYFLKSRVEVTLADKTRADIITKDHAIEVDFGEKWAESIGQSLHYGLQTKKTPGIVLILEQEKDFKYLERTKNIILNNNLNVVLWALVFNFGSIELIKINFNK